jgi:hypothetical protein
MLRNDDETHMDADSPNYVVTFSAGLPRRSLFVLLALATLATSSKAAHYLGRELWTPIADAAPVSSSLFVSETLLWGASFLALIMLVVLPTSFLTLADHNILITFRSHRIRVAAVLFALTIGLSLYVGSHNAMPALTVSDWRSDVHAAYVTHEKTNLHAAGLDQRGFNRILIQELREARHISWLWILAPFTLTSLWIQRMKVQDKTE